MTDKNKYYYGGSSGGSLNINAVQLDGSSKYFTFDTTGNSLVIANRTTYSFSFWFYYEAPMAGFVHLFSMWSTTLGRYFRVMLENNETIYYDNYGTNSTNDYIRQQSVQNTVANQWNHVVVTYNNSLSNTDKQEIYINGSLCTTNYSANSYAGGSYVGAGGVLSIGASNAGASLADIKVASLAGFSNVLSGANVTTLYNGGRYYSHYNNSDCFLAMDFSRNSRQSQGLIVNRSYLGNSVSTGIATLVTDGELTSL